MKKAGKASPPDDLRPEYEFDFSTAKPNPYASRLKGRTLMVVLDPDVARAFPSSEAVNAELRAALKAVPRRSRRLSVRRTKRSAKKAP